MRRLFAEDMPDPADELARLERRYLLGLQAGRDPQAGWLRRRIADLRDRRSTDTASSPSQRSSK